MIWLALGVGLGLAILVLAIIVFRFNRWVLRTYLDTIVRILEERPLFIIPRGQPEPEAEDITFPTTDGLTLRGCYLRAVDSGQRVVGSQPPAAPSPLPTTHYPLPTTSGRRGVILFGLEFGSNRWACIPYCQFLRRQGFDIFAFECRSSGESDRQRGYEPLVWVTEFEVADFHAAIAYLKARPDADPRGIGLFGLSKGGSAGLTAAAADPYVRCFVTDGIFATHITMVPYMRQFVRIYSKRHRIQSMIPVWYYVRIGGKALKKIEKQRGCRFAHLERAIRRLGDRPLLMIHGGGDTYIKPDMARALFDRAPGPKELWIVDNAKHNQAIHVANGEYHDRVATFFKRHLAGETPNAQERMPSELPMPKAP